MNICEQISARRNAGKVTCRLFHGTDVLPRKQSLAQLGLKDIPEILWSEVTRQVAEDLLTFSLSTDLAYDSAVMSKDEAKELSCSFLNALPTEVRFLTNTNYFEIDPADRTSMSWEPISHATFDTGIVAEGKGVVGILWIEDED